MPRRAETASSSVTLPAGSAPVSCSSRPIKVDLPWSTWPTMTMRCSARPASAAAGARESRVVAKVVVPSSFMPAAASLQVARGAQPLEGVLALVVHRPPGPLGGGGGLQLGDDLVDRGGLGGDRRGDVAVAQRAVALAVPGPIERHDGDALAPGVEHDVGSEEHTYELQSIMRT